MEALALDPAGYGGTYKLVGGRLAFDFVNTVSWSGTDREHDWFSLAENVVAWLAAVGVTPTVAVAQSDLHGIRKLRRVVEDAVGPLALGGVPVPDAINTLNSKLSAAAPGRIIDPATLTWTWGAAVVAIDMFRPVLFDAAELVVNAPRHRLKHCPSCQWCFEDQTRNGARRWCDMSDCGSRAKSRHYYHRTKAAGD